MIEIPVFFSYTGKKETEKICPRKGRILIRLLIVDPDSAAAERTAQTASEAIPDLEELTSVQTLQEARIRLERASFSCVLSEARCPDGDCRELAAWMRTHTPTTSLVLVTSTESFALARDAVNLGIIGYLKKPVRPAPLAASIRRSVTARRRQNARFSRSVFWYKLLNEVDVPEVLDPQRYGFSDDETRQIFPFLVVWKQTDPSADAWSDTSVRFLLRNVVSELLFHSTNSEDVLAQGNEVLALYTGQDSSVNVLLQRCEQALKTCGVYLGGCQLSGYVCGKIAFPELKGSLHQLQSYAQQDPNKQETVVDIRKTVPKSTMPFPREDIELWTQGLFSRDYQICLDKLCAFLDEKYRTDSWNTSLLRAFQATVLQKLNWVFNLKQISVTEALPYERFESLFSLAADSIEDMKHLLRELALALKDYRDFGSRTAVIASVQEYILSHLNQTISRNDLADLVYLHPDYLSHIFKMQTGMSLSDYITAERIREAKRQLISTSDQISEIARSIGYSSSAYFIKIFKREIGMTPNEYRKKNRLKK